MGVFDSIIYGVKTYTPGTVFSDAQSVPTEQDKILDIAVSESAKRLAESPTSIGYELNRLGDADKYSKVGLQRNVELLRAQREGNLEKILADSQSNFQKTRNALAQTLVSEVGLCGLIVVVERSCYVRQLIEAVLRIVIMIGLVSVESLIHIGRGIYGEYISCAALSELYV